MSLFDAEIALLKVRFGFSMGEIERLTPTAWDQAIAMLTPQDAINEAERIEKNVKALKEKTGRDSFTFEEVLRA